jgi:hypothetical protein
VWKTVGQVRQRVREPKTTLATVQGPTATAPDDQVPAAVYARQDAPSSQPVRFASLVEAVRDSGLSVDIGGYVKGDLIHDFDAIASTDNFDTATIFTDGRVGAASSSCGTYTSS